MLHIPLSRPYGIYRPEMVTMMPWQNLPEGIEFEVGQQLQIQRDGEPAVGVTVVEVTNIYILIGCESFFGG